MRIHVKVIPGAKCPGVFEEWKDLMGISFYKVKTHAKPIEGQANKECIELLSSHFGVKNSQIHILQWAQNTQKVIEIIL